MKIYLVRHGEALPPEVDPEKGLSPDGRAGIEKLGRHFAEKSFPLFGILHSTKKRAQETAEILGKHLEPELQLESCHYLAPNDPIDEMMTRIEAEERDFMIVGHLPFLNKLVGRLIADNENLEEVQFGPGTTVCLKKLNGNWSIDWVVGLDQV